jgi:hypothetical protein
MEKRNELAIRQVAGASPNPALGPCVRVNIRIDFYAEAQTIDWSWISWRHPQAVVIDNLVQVGVGPILHGVLVSDLCSKLAQYVDDFGDPFP